MLNQHGFKANVFIYLLVSQSPQLELIKFLRTFLFLFGLVSPCHSKNDKIEHIDLTESMGQEKHITQNKKPLSRIM